MPGKMVGFLLLWYFIALSWLKKEGAHFYHYRIRLLSNVFNFSVTSSLLIEISLILHFFLKLIPILSLMGILSALSAPDLCTLHGALRNKD
jgi:hypothetical protein